MTTIDQMSPADQEVLAKASSSEVLECSTCGRDCKHVPSLPGGGTAGGEKNTKWAETPRSAARCPACGQKPHRKEGRPHQLNNCYLAQAGLAMGLTTFPTPTAEVYRKAAEMLELGHMKDTPTEKQMTLIIAGIPVDEAMKPTERKAAAPKTSRQVPKIEPGGEAIEGIKADPIALPELPEMKVAPTIKTKEQKEAEKAEAKWIKDAEKAEAKRVRDEARAQAKADAAAAREAKKGETKAQKEARLLARAEAGTTEEAPAPGEAEGEDDDYDPLAGVGEVFDTGEDDQDTESDTDDDDDDDELSPEQRAALLK